MPEFIGLQAGYSTTDQGTSPPLASTGVIKDRNNFDPKNNTGQTTAISDRENCGFPTSTKETSRDQGPQFMI